MIFVFNLRPICWSQGDRQLGFSRPTQSRQEEASTPEEQSWSGSEGLGESRLYQVLSFEEPLETGSLQPGKLQAGPLPWLQERFPLRDNCFSFYHAAPTGLRKKPQVSTWFSLL